MKVSSEKLEAALPPGHGVLLGAGGTGTAFGAACALRRVWSESIRLITMDINPARLVTTSLLANAFEQVPLSASPEFPSVLSEIVRKHHIDTYLPLLPGEIVLAAQMLAEGLLPADLRLLAPPPSASRICGDKWLTACWLIENGLPSPRTALAGNPFPSDYYFLKPRGGSGSRDARLVSASDLLAVIGDTPDQWIVQEPCHGPEVTVDAFHDPADDFSFAVCRERLEIKSGVSVKSRLFADEALASLARSLARKLPLRGSFCFQVMHNGKSWMIIDINARPGAATAMCAAAGCDFFAASFALAWGEEVRQFFTSLGREVFVTRQYVEFVTG